MSRFEGAKLYKDVAALDEETKDTVVPNGEIWEVVEFVGASCYLDDAVVCLIWDPAGDNEIVACTHGDTKNEPFYKVTGDGVKVFRIALTNDTNQARVLGAKWDAKVIS